jgi:YD repeat-containing protein
LAHGPSGQSRNDKAKKVSASPPQPGAPAAQMPNIEEVRPRSHQAPKAANQVESMVRSRRKPLEPRNGRKVGDPLPSRKASANSTRKSGERASVEMRGPKETGRSHHARRVGSFNFLMMPMPQGGGAQNVSWTNVVGVSASGSNLTKNSAEGWNAGAVSTQTIPSGDGYMEVTATETNTHRRIGLSNGDTNQSYDDIDFCLYLNADGTVYINEGATGRGNFGSYAGGDRFRVAVEGGVVKYKKNGAVFYTSTIAPTYPLLVDTSLYTNGATLTNVTLVNDPAQNVSWTNVVGVSASGNSLTKNSAEGWNAGAVSTQTIPSGDGYMEVTATETNTHRRIGLSNGDTNQSYDDIDFCLYLNADGMVYINEGATGRGNFGSYASGDRFRVAVEGGVVKYEKNGAVFYTSTIAPTYPLLVDTSLYTNGATLTNVTLVNDPAQNVIWTNVVGVSASGNNLTKNSAPGWNAGAVSTQTIPSGDGYMEVTATETNTHRRIGLSNGDTNQSYDDIDFCLYLNADGMVYINEGATGRGNFGSYAPGDRFRVAVEGGVVKYKRNGAVFYTSTIAPTYPLLVDTSFYTNGATLTNVVIGTYSTEGTFNEQYPQNFIHWALARQPTPDEANYWEDVFRAAYAHQQGSMTIAVREMARTMFESAEYAGRARDNHWYVYDLYKTYLMREPDAPGWQFWEGQCNSYGRDQVRRAFDECSEFAGDVAAITPNGSATTAVSSVLSARVDPSNQPGNQLLTRDAEWSASLLSLPGRAGLDLGLGLSYSSNVWTRSGPYAYFDEDNGTLSPGFRMGFPTVQEVFFDAQVGGNVRMLITGSGQRVELRQVGTTNVYEAADSSYLQLIDYGNTVTVRSTDGTQMSYTKLQDEWRCTQIEDRNGNLITIVNDWRGDIQNITDTLGRVITFNYDANANLTSITQAGRTNPWVTFGWGTVTMAPPLSGVVGTRTGEIIPVLASVNFADSSYDKFLYNPSGQVRRITHYASDSNPETDTHERAHTVFTYGASDDLTRLTNISVSAENWTDINNVPAEVVTEFGIEGTAHTLKVVGDPNGTVYKESYGTGWQRGLVVSAEVWAGGALQKTTTTSWAKDANTSNSFPTNPRVIQTDIIDSAQNHSRTTIGYNTFPLPGGASCSLPNQVDEYADVTSVARRSHTDYNLDTPYLNARIIGLPQAKLLYAGTSTLMGRTTYEYDSGGEFLQGLPSTPTQHDGNYSTDFVVGRGNLVKVLRWDVSDTSNTLHTESKAGYDIAGSVRFTRDALDHQTTINYTDAFSANGIALDAPRSFATFAYPTTVTDPDGYSSSLWYRYDFGARTRAQGPPPADQPNGIIQTFTYDDAARIQRVTTANTGAYTRYVYGPTYVQSYGTVNNVGDEAYSIRVFDGAGRPVGAATNHPGSIGGYSAVYSIYDLMGRVIKQSSPTEITGGWAPTGDDAVGWIFTQQTYDWKGRPLLTVNPSTTGNPNDTTTKEASYSACGCAGNEIVTLEDELGRRQKVYSDVLGRQWKTEILNSDSSVYSANVSIYNGRDQIVRVKQYSGAAASDATSTYEAASCPTGTCQESTMSYDGYGRLQSKHVPEQNAGTATVYAYNPDDTILSVTDARGASATYGYNNSRGLVNNITYSAPSGVAPTSNPTFTYDATGNRKSMTDGTGTTSYAYDQLSRMSSETHAINGVGNYTIGYGYNLANELTTVTAPFGQSVSYNHDTAGRLNGISGTGFPNVSQFASNVQYRAWGGIKNMTYGNGKTLSVGYNSRLAPATYQIPSVLNKTYQYFDDDSLKSASDLLDHRYDRAMQYDPIGRLAVAQTGTEARGGSTPDGPFNQTYQYDAFGHTIARTSRQWTNIFTDSGNSYHDERHNGWSYDADGNVTNNADVQFTYNAAGLPTQTVNVLGGSISANTFDGDGQRIKSAFQLNSSYAATTRFYLRATPLGGKVVAEILSSGEKVQGYVYAGNELMAVQKLPVVGDSANYVVWRHEEPSGSVRATDEGGGQNWAAELNSAELDATGVNMGKEDTGSDPLNTLRDENNPDFHAMGNPSRLSGGCTFNGMPIADCGFLMKSSSFDKFNLVSAAADASKPKLRNYEVDYGEGRPWDFGFDKEGALYIARRTRDTKVVANWLYSDPTWFSAAVNETKNPQNASFIAQKIRTDIGAAQARLKGDKGCRDFLNQLLASVEPKTDMIDGQKLDSAGHWVRNDIFDALDEMSHGSFEETSKSGVTRDGSLETINDLSTPVGSRHVLVNNSYATQSDEVRMFAVIHESLHMFAGFTDQALASAARQIVGDRAKLYSGDPAGTKQASEDLNYYIQRKCPGLKADKGTTYRIGE